MQSCVRKEAVILPPSLSLSLPLSPPSLSQLTRENGTAPLTVYKTVFDLEIPLHNSGPAGLGVTVYTKSMSLKDGGEMGVYIKSIVAGGAAAMVRETGLRG